MERERIAADKATVTDYAELAGLDPYAWSNLIEQGWSVADIREKIKQAVEDKRIRGEQAEQQRIAKQEHDAALAKLAEEQAMQQAKETDSGALYDPNTGELIATNEEAVSTAPELITAVLQLTGTIDQMNDLNQYIVDHNIKVVPVQ